MNDADSQAPPDSPIDAPGAGYGRAATALARLAMAQPILGLLQIPLAMTLGAIARELGVGWLAILPIQAASLSAIIGGNFPLACCALAVPALVVGVLGIGQSPGASRGGDADPCARALLLVLAHFALCWANHALYRRLIGQW